MRPIYYTTEQAQQINDLKSYIEDYCQTNNIDPTVYTTYLDSRSTLPPEIINDPVFQAHWKVAYLELMELVDPALYQTLYGQIGADNFNFDTAYPMVDPEFNQFLESLVLDNPQLMAFLAQSDGNPDTSPDAVIQAIAQLNPAPAIPPYVDQMARDLIEQFGMENETVNWLLGTEEGNISMQQAIMVDMAKADEQLASLRDALRNGTMSADEFNAGVGQVSSQRDISIAMLGDLQGKLTNIFQMFSNLLKSLADSVAQIQRNWTAGV